MMSLHIISYEIYQICDNKYMTLLVSCLSLIWHIFNESSRRTRCLVDPVDPWKVWIKDGASDQRRSREAFRPVRPSVWKRSKLILI